MSSSTSVKIHEKIDLDKIAGSGQCFRWCKTDNGYRIPFKETDLVVSQSDPYTLVFVCKDHELETIWKDYFDLQTNYEEICSRISKEADPFLHEAIKNQKGIRILKQDPWEMLITSIITQNRNIPAIQKSVELLSEKAGTKCQSITGSSFFAFPTPSQLANMSDRCLSDCKLGYRMAYVRDAARVVASGELSLEQLELLSDEECDKRLLSLKGVGEKVAACILLFGFHRLNAFPMDVWMKRILDNEYPNGYPKAKYSPFNGLYQQYMFAYYRELYA